MYTNAKTEIETYLTQGQTGGIISKNIKEHDNVMNNNGRYNYVAEYPYGLSVDKSLSVLVWMSYNGQVYYSEVSVEYPALHN